MEISNTREASLDGKVSELSPQNWAARQKILYLNS